MSDILAVTGLTVRGPARSEVLSNVNLSLRSGEILGLVGETGSGKTTLINSILGLLPDGLRIISGSVNLHDGQIVDLSRLGASRRRHYLGRDIGYVPQEVRSGLNPLMTVRASVLEGARRRKGTSRERTESALLKAGLTVEFLHRDANRRPGRLSGGQCQRVLIAQAIVNSPRVLLLDEPTASLDPPTRRDVLDTIRSLANDRCAILLVTHDIAAVSAVADAVAVMYAGRVVETGRVSRVLGKPQHPYTRALLDCVPRLDRRQPLTVILGEAPAEIAQLTGCKFHPRCPHREERCSLQEPALREIQSEQKVACHVVVSRIHEGP